MKNFKFNTAQLSIMLALQDKFNSSLNPEWMDFEKQPDRDDILAIVCESGEAIEHFGFKWWKTQTPDLNQVRMELVDIWHFLMSQMLRVSHSEVVGFFAHHDIGITATPSNEIQARIFSSVVLGVQNAESNHFKSGLVSVEGASYTDSKKSFLYNLLKPLFEKFDPSKKISDNFVTQTFSNTLNAFFDCMNAVDMNFEDMFLWYIGKNALNVFRQRNGYKQGTYIKIWSGREDNEYLTDYLGTLAKLDQGFDPETLFDDVLNHMQNTYASHALITQDECNSKH